MLSKGDGVLCLGSAFLSASHPCIKFASSGADGCLAVVVALEYLLFAASAFPGMSKRAKLVSDCSTH